jgi:hypothetical protein
VGAGADQDEQLVGELVDEQPVAAQVALAVVLPVAGQGVVAVVRRERIPGLEGSDGLEKPAGVPAGAANALLVLLELLFAEDFAHQSSRSALRASTVAKRGRSPVGSAIASRVAWLGSGLSTSRVRTARAGPVTGSAGVMVPSAETVASMVLRVADTLAT